MIYLNVQYDNTCNKVTYNVLAAIKNVLISVKELDSQIGE